MLIKLIVYLSFPFRAKPRFLLAMFTLQCYFVVLAILFQLRVTTKAIIEKPPVDAYYIKLCERLIPTLRPFHLAFTYQ